MVKAIIILSVLIAIASATNFCNVETCYGHTMCIFASPAPSARCGINPIIGLTYDEKYRILYWHNYLRQKVASGLEYQGNPGPQPPAAYMAYMEWDNELAAVAQRWANQCTWGHDRCRDVDRFRVGQNIAYGSTFGNWKPVTIETLIALWYDEVRDFNRNDVKTFTSIFANNGNVIGHYTQLVWAKTSRIGCGGIRYNDGGWDKFYLVCNYGPTGNFFGMPVY